MLVSALDKGMMSKKPAVAICSFAVLIFSEFSDCSNTGSICLQLFRCYISSFLFKC